MLIKLTLVTSYILLITLLICCPSARAQAVTNTSDITLDSSSSTGSTTTSTEASSSSSTGSSIPVPTPIQIINNVYSIDWNAVPGTSLSLPITANTEIGRCICDLTWDSCDVNCGCDTSCSDSEKAGFSGSLPSGPVTASVPMCLDPNFVQINSHGALTVTLINNMLCVTDDNNPSKGSYFSPPTSLSSAQFSSALSSSPYSFNPSSTAVTTSTTTTTTSTSTGNYKVDAVLRAAKKQAGDTNTNPLYSVNNGKLVLPSSGLSGQCSNNNFVRYMRDSTQSCYQSTSSLSSSCSSSFLPFYNNMYVGIRDTSLAATGYVDFVQILVANVYYVDPDTNQQTLLSSDGSAAPTPYYNVSTRQCRYVMSRSELSLKHEITGSISGASVNIYLTSVYGSTSDFATVLQTYSVSFILSDATTLPRAKSGNPGYLIGRPVLSGTRVGYTDGTTSKTAVAQDVNGLQVMATADNGLCATTSTSSSSLTRPVVGFGQDARYSCYLELDWNQFQQTCVNGVLNYLGNTSLPTVLGIFGNANYLVSSDWIDVGVPDTPLTPSAPSADRKCVGIANTINIQIVTAWAGNVLNPQYEIIAVKRTYSTSDWQFSNEDSVPQRFPLMTTVTFVNAQEQQVYTYTPKAPPILPQFPSDLLYPLYIPNSASSHSSTFLIISSLFIINMVLQAWFR